MLEYAKKSATLLMIAGIIAVVFGIIAVAWPVKTVFALVLVWGWYALFDGGLALFSAASLKESRTVLIITGVIGIAAGLFAIFRPVESALVMAWVLGLWLIIRGGIIVLSAFVGGLKSIRWVLILSGALFVIGGIVFIANPESAAVALSLTLGILAISWGIFIFGSGFSLRKTAKEAVV